MVPGWGKSSLPAGTRVEAGQKPMPAPSVYSSLQEAGFQQEPRSIARAPSSVWPKQAWANFSRDLLAGALMGGVAHTIVAPIERTKLLLQTQDSNMAIMGGHHKRYNGMLDCMARIVREEGPLSLWRGNGSSVLRYYPSVALNFSCKVFLAFRRRKYISLSLCLYGISPVHRPRRGLLSLVDLYRTILSSGEKTNNIVKTAQHNFVAGALAGCTALVVVYPLDIAHTRLAADMGRAEARQFKGLLHFINTIYKKDGMRGLYRGLPASIHGMIVHRSVYFGGFDTAKDIMLKESASIPFWKRWLAAQAVTTSAGLISYPLDTVRRRMMMQAGLERRMYSNTFECWKKIYRTEGARSFYRGAISNMFRGTGAALILVLYDELKHFMRWDVPAIQDNNKKP